MPSVLPAEPTTLRHKYRVRSLARNIGYTVLEFLASGSDSDVYKALQKSTGELFALKVMKKSKKTAQMTTEQQRELNLMRELQRNRDHVLKKLLGWRETSFMIFVLPLNDQTLATVHPRTQCSVVCG